MSADTWTEGALLTVGQPDSIIQIFIVKLRVTCNLSKPSGMCCYISVNTEHGVNTGDLEGHVSHV